MLADDKIFLCPECFNNGEPRKRRYHIERYVLHSIQTDYRIYYDRAVSVLRFLRLDRTVNDELIFFSINESNFATMKGSSDMDFSCDMPYRYLIETFEEARSLENQLNAAEKP